MAESLEDLLGAYWDVAYQEGHLGRPNGTQAQEVLSAIRAAVEQARSDAVSDETINPWKQTLIDACVINWVGIGKGDTPQTLLAKLIATNCREVLDPAVSKQAVELIEQARREEREACAIAAWSAGMEYHNRVLGMPTDAREVGSAGAAAIRARNEKGSK